MWRKLGLTISFVIGVNLILAMPVYAARYELVPATGQVIANCQDTFQVFADVTGQSSNTADLLIFYNPALVQVSQVIPGDAYQAYVSNQIDNTIGRIRVTALSVDSNLTTRKLFATVRYATIATGTNVQFNVQFNGNGVTTDSNIADSATSLDLLTGVTNASFLIVPGSCTPDSTAPAVQFVAPTAGQANFTTDTPLQVRVTDGGSGVNLDSVQIVVDGQTYTRNSPEVQFTGTPANYLFTLNIPGLAVGVHTLSVSGSDIAGNNFSQQTNFTIVPPGSATSTSSASSSSQPCECAEPGVINLPQVQDIVQGTVFDNTILETILVGVDSNVGTASSAAALTGLAVLLSLLPYLSLLSTPGLLLNVIGFLLGKHREKSWGVIVDGATRAPVVFATCRIYLYGAKTFVAQTVSDTAGRYGFALAPGKYRMEVLHDKYVKHVSEIIVQEGKSTPVQDIVIYPLSLLHGSRQTARDMLREVRGALGRFWRQIYPAIFIIGFILAILGFATLPSPINAIILVLYVVLSMIAMLGTRLSAQVQSSVVDAVSNLRVPGAVVKIYNPKTWEVVDTQTTNANGMFDYWGEEGEFAVLVVARGYSFPSKIMPPAKTIKRNKLELPLMALKTGSNRLILYVDPLETNDIVSYNDNKPSNLANPFH